MDSLGPFDDGWDKRCPRVQGNASFLLVLDGVLPAVDRTRAGEAGAGWGIIQDGS
jgi:hypothetical protein